MELFLVWNLPDFSLILNRLQKWCLLDQSRHCPMSQADFPLPPSPSAWNVCGVGLAISLMVMSAVLRQQQVSQWFASPPVWEGRIESLYCRIHISGLTIVAAKALPKCLFIKIKDASTAWVLLSHTAEQYTHSGLHLVLALVCPAPSKSSSAMHFTTRSHASALASKQHPQINKMLLLRALGGESVGPV